MSVEENNKALVREFFEEVWSKGNVAAMDKFMAADFVVHDTLTTQAMTCLTYGAMVATPRS